MKYEYHFYHTLTVFIRIEDEDFYFIYQCAKNHYDSKVVGLTEVGGFLYGWKNRRELFSSPEDDRKEIEFTSRQLDICSKAIEFSDGEEQTLRLRKMFYQIHQELGKAMNDQNKNVVKHFI